MKHFLSLVAIALTYNQVSCEMTEPVNEPKYVKFFEWLKANGAVYDGIELRKESDAMRGVYALRDYKEEEELLFIPDKLILSYEKALDSEIGKQMKELNMVRGYYKLNHPVIVTMAVRNMYE